MSFIRLFEMAATDVPTPPAGKFSLFFDSATGEPSFKDDAGVVTSLVGIPGQGVPVGGTTGQVLAKINATDYNTQWITVTGSPGGSDTQVQFNDGGSFGGDAGLVYNKTTDTLTLVNATYTGIAITAASASGSSGLRVPHGAAPSSPTNGDVWTTTAGMFVRVNGVTVGPLGAAGSATWGSITGTLSSQTDLQAALDAKAAVGIPQNSQSSAYTLVIGDANKHIYHPSADTTARIWTIPANSSVAFPIGTAVTFVNDTSAGVITIAITTDTLVLAGAGTTGSRTLAANGVATAIKITSTRWQINGTGLT